MYKTFVRDWWRKDGNGNIVPYAGAPKRTHDSGLTRDEARQQCEDYNDSHDAGWRSRKMEFEEE